MLHCGPSSADITVRWDSNPSPRRQNNNPLHPMPYFTFTDRQTDRYFIDRNKSHYRLICHGNKRDICTCIYKNVSLLKSYMTIYMV